MRTCRICGPRPEADFYPATRRLPVSYSGTCRPCKGKSIRAAKDRNRAANINGPGAHPAKRCTYCRVTKPAEMFGRSLDAKSGLRARCLVCQAATETRTPDYRRRERLRNYGLTTADYDSMLAAQDGKCGICERHMTKPMIDHCHATKRVRRLLCCRCNNWLAAVEDADFMARARAYLARHAAGAMGSGH